MLFVPRDGKGYCCSFFAVAAFSTTMATSVATADDVPSSLKLHFGNETFDWLVGQDGNTEYTDNGYIFSGNDFGSGWNLNWEVMASGSEFVQSITSTFSVINTTNSTQLYTLYFAEPVMMTSTSSLVGGSVGGYVVDLNGDGAFLQSASSSDSIYSGFVDASESGPLNEDIVGRLLTGASLEVGGFFTGNFTPESFGNVPSIPGQSGPGIEDNIGFGLTFALSAGDAAGFSASFAARIPGPGTAGLLGIAALCGRRRRRRK